MKKTSLMFVLLGVSLLVTTSIAEPTEPADDATDDDDYTDIDSTDEDYDSVTLQPRFLCMFPVVGDGGCVFACRSLNYDKGSCEGFVCKCEDPIPVDESQ